MPITDICIYFIIAILGLAYPVSLQVISRLDEKYRSKNIIGLFKKEPFWGIFEWSLFVTITAIFYRIVSRLLTSTPGAAPAKVYQYDDWILIILTAVVLLFFILYTKKVFVYYTPNQLTQYFRAKKDNDSHDYFNSMADLLYMSLLTEDEGIARTVSGYAYERFKAYRVKAGIEPCRYPDAYYDFAYRTVALTSKITSRTMTFLAYNVASSRWFLGEMSYTNIDKQTYAWMWINTGVLVENGADDYVLEFWQNSHQFISTSLPRIPMEHDQETFEITNKEEIDFREAERDQFYEFHYALGGLLLYQDRYDAIRRIFNYTTSIPPNYELLPGTFTTIFNVFFRFWNYYNWEFPYRFPKADGIHGESLSKSWIGRFMALLLLRQYSLVSFWYGYDPLSPPNLPNTQAERQVWIDNLTSFRSFVTEILDNRTLMKSLGFDYMTPDWFAEKNVTPPLTLIDQTLQALNAHLAEEAVEQKPSAEKVKSFLSKSSSIISSRLASYAPALNATKIQEDFHVVTIRGISMIYDKAAFADDQGVSYLNYDTFASTSLSTEITYRITHSFATEVSTSLLLKDEDVIKALDKLDLNTNDHVILNFGVDLENLKAKTKAEGLTTERYNDIEIRSVEYMDRRVIGGSLFVTRKTDLPQFEYGVVPQEKIDKFGLISINTGINLYGAVIDLNEKPELKATLPKGDADLDTSVLLTLEMRLEMRWRNGAKLIEIKRYSEFFQKGVPNKIDEVNPF